MLALLTSPEESSTESISGSPRENEGFVDDQEMKEKFGCRSKISGRHQSMGLQARI